MSRPVVDRPHLEAAFERAPGLFDPLQLIVAQGYIGGCQAVIVAMHHAFASELFGGASFSGVNPQPPAFGQTQRATIATTGPQLTHPFTEDIQSTIGPGIDQAPLFGVLHNLCGSTFFEKTAGELS